MAPDLCGQLFSILMLMNLVHTCLFHQVFACFSSVIINRTQLHYHAAHREKHYHLMKMEGESKSQKKVPKNKISLGLLHQRMLNKSTRSLLSRDNANVWQEIEVGVDPETFCTSYQIPTINKNSRSKTPLKSNTPFKWLFMDIIPAISSKSLTKDTTFSKFLLIIIPKFQNFMEWKISLLRKSWRS